MQDFFDAPPEGAIPTTTDRANSVKYKNTKGIGEDFADTITPEWIAEKFGAGNYGFSMYDRESKSNISLKDFSFVVLEVYAGVSGYDGDSVSYYSSRAKDTRVDELVVYASNHAGPIAKGLYQSIRPQLPDSAKYAKFVKAYCLQTESVVEIKLSAMVESAMKKAIAATEQSETKRKSWDKVFILSLADNDHLWGFHLGGHCTTDIKGNDYAGKGDLFFSPVFRAGVVSPVKSPELHAKCVQLQNEERALHQSYKAKYAAEVAQEEPQERLPNNYAFHDNGGTNTKTFESINTKVTGSPAASAFPVTNRAEPVDNPAVAAGMDGLQEPVGEDLPF